MEIFLDNIAKPKTTKLSDVELIKCLKQINHISLKDYIFEFRKRTSIEMNLMNSIYSKIDQIFIFHSDDETFISLNDSINIEDDKIDNNLNDIF